MEIFLALIPGGAMVLGLVVFGFKMIDGVVIQNHDEFVLR